MWSLNGTFLSLCTATPPLYSFLGYLFCLYIPFVAGNYSETVSDAQIAIELKPSYLKAFVRGKI